VEVGRLLERLESLGLSDDVVIAVVADHGEEFQEHGRMFHGQSAYGELANVPLLLYGPGRIPAGVAVGRTVRSIDVMPTLLAISGLEAPPDVQGQSLLPLVAAAASGSEPDPQLWETRPAVTEKATEPVADPDDPSNHESYALVLDGWKLIHHVIRPEERPEYELFDHDEDPLDLHNVADEHPEEVEKLKAELELWQNAVEQAKLPRAEEAVENLPADELERLRNLGYIQ
jgi:arylsulfatase A-like enzyme